MKKILLTLIAGVFYASFACAQGQAKRNVHFNFIAEDSIKLALNEDFDLIEDSCSQVIRYAHLNMGIGRKFVGKIKDVSRLDPNIIVTEGTYNEAGEKDGLFITHHINGQLSAKGRVLKNKYDGRWELFYADGKPRLVFEAKGDDITIFDVWNEKGIKTVDNGKGIYKVDMGYMYWQGKLLAGKPEGSWSLSRNDEAKTEMASEKFKAGTFQKGKSPIGEYVDKSRINILTAQLLPFTRAELLKVSAQPCGYKRKVIVSAKYRDGSEAYTRMISGIIGGYLNPANVNANQSHFGIVADINEKGMLTNITGKVIYSAYYKEVPEGFIINLKRLPPLQPATVDGVFAKQKIAFDFVFEQRDWRYSYRFLGVQTN